MPSTIKSLIGPHTSIRVSDEVGPFLGPQIFPRASDSAIDLILRLSID